MDEVKSIDEFFGCDVFGDRAMSTYLPKDVYRKLKKTIEDGAELDRSIAGVVAHGMKEWAIQRGATHYTHWFQPLSGVSAEKQESFISSVSNQKVILEFSAKELVKGESDASSFPSGGLRATFEARGYTAWDCTSPAFLRKDAIGITLCIPTAFCSYKGEALDRKTPLLRSMQAIDKEAIRLLRLFGNERSQRVVPSVGAEQEYFIVDRDMYLKRKDLIYAGRTLFGAMPPKGQELDDHYYGTIRDRVARFMNDLNHELWKMGVPAKTQHNEAAPGQHELAPIYEQVNVATDHNQLVMETMKRLAFNHNLHCLLHEKPFAGVNGSGKHNNWSLITDDKINMLNPGATPHENMQFLLVLACILRAVDRHAELLRETAATVGNDARLGSNEAPPAIISVFLGEQLEDVIDQLCSTGLATHSIQGGILKTGVNTLPDFEKDATDRNRTSPFAFTNNKFEFRMLGSSESIASANVVLNTIVAESFKEAVDELESATDFEMTLHDYVKTTFAAHRRIIFNGNGYSKEWVEEAKRRGLPNIPSAVEAISAIVSKKAVKLYEDFNVFTKAELEARLEIEYEAYSKAINIEAKTMLNMAGKSLLPAIMKYSGDLAKSIKAVRDLDLEVKPEEETKILEKIVKLHNLARESFHKLDVGVKEVSAIADIEEKAFAYHRQIVPVMKDLRVFVDELEMLVDKEYWPMPSYGDLIFEI
jgi:hypothetical protein